VHPALERTNVESRFFLDFAIADRRAAQDPADPTLLVRLPEHQPWSHTEAPIL
jgi:hypothetical protein